MSSTRTSTYTYDGLQRLTGAVESPGAMYVDTYDLIGNRTDNAANQVIGWTYDAAGNLLSDGTTTSSYDALNRLTTQGASTYAYNGDGTVV